MTAAGYRHKEASISATCGWSRNGNAFNKRNKRVQIFSATSQDKTFHAFFFCRKMAKQICRRSREAFFYQPEPSESLALRESGSKTQRGEIDIDLNI